MRFRTVEWVAGALAVIVPVVVAIWVAAAAVTEMAAIEDRLADLERTMATLEETQVEDRLVNGRVDKLAEHVDWLRYHHHHEDGEGHPHID